MQESSGLAAKGAQQGRAYWVVCAAEGHVVAAGQRRVLLPQVHLQVAEEVHILPGREGHQRPCTGESDAYSQARLNTQRETILAVSGMHASWTRAAPTAPMMVA